MKYLLLIATIALGCTLPLHAGEDHKHSHENITIPATLPEVRAEITAQQQKLAASLTAKDAKTAHAATDTLSALVQAVPGMTEGLDEATVQRLKGMANNAAKAWGNAAHDAEHGDYDKAGREATKAEAAYRLLEARLAP